MKYNIDDIIYIDNEIIDEISKSLINQNFERYKFLLDKKLRIIKNVNLWKVIVEVEDSKELENISLMFTMTQQEYRLKKIIKLFNEKR